MAPGTSQTRPDGRAGGRSDGGRPVLAFIVNVVTPYRLHVHQRLAREIPEVRLATLITHDQADQPWEAQRSAEVGPVEFGRGHPVSETARRKHLSRDWRKGGEIIAWLKEHRAAAVIVAGYNDVTRLRVIAWCKRAGVPVYLTADSNVHGDRASGLKRLIKKIYVGWILRGLAGVMPCGSAGATYFERYGVARNHIFYHPYEPDYQLIRDITPQQIAAQQQKHGLDPARRRIVLCARLVPVKRVDLAIDAFARIAGERPEWDLVLIGDGPLRKELEARVPEALKARVRFLGFIGDQGVISALYRGSDVLVLPSDYEPWAVVINEAVAAGLAVVASDVVGAAIELVKDGVNGRVFPAGNLDALSAALREVTDPNRIGPMRAAAPAALADWIRRGDPVAGVRAALVQIGVLKTQPQTEPPSKDPHEVGASARR